MKVPVKLAAIAMMLTACGGGYDPAKVQKGMDTNELIEAVGEPAERMPLTKDHEFWRYEDDHTVLMGKGRVVNTGVMSDDEYKMTLQEMQRAMNTMKARRSE